MVGGHPRTLEYLDALLRGGEAEFPDVADRLRTALSRRGVADPQQWMTGIKGDLDTALAETVTLAADDVLLDGLLASLEDAPPASGLLRRLAVYRQPVDETGAAWQLSGLTSLPDPPAELVARLQPIWDALGQARQAGTAASIEKLGLAPAVLAQYHADVEELARPPVSLSAAAHQALELLTGLGLVAPMADTGADEESATPGLFVHRWTAAALMARTSPAELTDAHGKAALYWRWRVAVWPQTRAADIEQLLEARYHHHAAGDLDEALDANVEACSQLRTWGAWTTERQLWADARTWFPPRSRQAAGIHHELGRIAENRGDYDTAEEHYQDARAIIEGIGDRTNTAIAYHQLGILAQDRGDYDTAERHYRDSLAIEEELGNRAATAASYHQLGNVAYLRGDLGAAERWYRDSLAIKEEIGDRVGAADTYHQLRLMATNRGDYETGEQRYQDALATSEESGDRSGAGSTLSQLGILRTKQGRPADGVSYQVQALVIHAELQSPLLH
jgi:tetratricopeptide (TPR) repeat protein